MASSKTLGMPSQRDGRVSIWLRCRISGMLGCHPTTWNRVEASSCAARRHTASRSGPSPTNRMWCVGNSCRMRGAACSKRSIPFCRVKPRHAGDDLRLVRNRPGTQVGGCRRFVTLNIDPVGDDLQFGGRHAHATLSKPGHAVADAHDPFGSFCSPSLDMLPITRRIGDAETKTQGRWARVCRRSGRPQRSHGTEMTGRWRAGFFPSDVAVVGQRGSIGKCDWHSRNERGCHAPRSAGPGHLVARRDE